MGLIKYFNAQNAFGHGFFNNSLFTILGTVPSTGRILLVVGDESTAVLVLSSAQQLDLEESTIDSILPFLFTFPFPSRIRTLLSCEVGSCEEPWASALSLSSSLLSTPQLDIVSQTERYSLAVVCQCCQCVVCLSLCHCCY